jgi:glycosyltransferase involved in cell wall biosynthesis
MSQYHIIIGEGTPKAGGMCAHMRLLADGLAEASEQVHVWSPTLTDLGCRSPRVTIHTTLGEFSLGDFYRTERELNQLPRARRLLVYWVPHAYGYKSMNVLLCLWIWIRSAVHKDRVELMVQECFLDFSKHSLRQSAAAFIHRIMMVVLLNAADYVWIAIPSYKKNLRPYTLGKRVPFDYLPVPSNVAVVENSLAVAEARKRFAPNGLLIGHFGTFGRNITELLEKVIPTVLRELDASLVLLGTGGDVFCERLLQLFPDLAGRIHATGYLDDAALSAHLAACDVMVQPYGDGVTGRRGSTLAPLAHGCLIVTNSTGVTEHFWKETGAVVLAPLNASDFVEAIRRLQSDPGERRRISTAARETYLRYFEPSRMVKIIHELKT